MQTIPTALGCALITRDGQEFELKAQGWNPLKEDKQNIPVNSKNIFNSYNTDNKQTNFLSVFFITGSLADSKSFTTFATAIKQGAIAQLVEQRTENPCVPGSIPGGTTIDSVISRNPLKFSHFNGFSFILQYANSSRFEYLEMSHSVAFSESL